MRICPTRSRVGNHLNTLARSCLGGCGSRFTRSQSALQDESHHLTDELGRASCLDGSRFLFPDLHQFLGPQRKRVTLGDFIRVKDFRGHGGILFECTRKGIEESTVTGSDGVG